jgi:hypothetical protein
MITRVTNWTTGEMVEWDDTLDMTVARCIWNQCWEGDKITVTTRPGRLS